MKLLTNYSMQEINWNPATRKILKNFRNSWNRLTQAVEKNGMLLLKLETSKEQQLKATV